MVYIMSEKTTFKFLEGGILTTSNKIILIVTGILFAVSTGLSIFFAAIIGYFGIDIAPQWSIAPYAVFFALLLFATFVTIAIIVFDMVINKNYNEYVELLKRVPVGKRTEEDIEFEKYIFSD